MKKYNKRYLYYSIVRDFLFCCFAFGGLLLVIGLEFEDKFIITNKTLIISCISAGSAFIVLLIYSLLYYKMTGYELKENEIVFKYGVLMKGKTVLSYDKIHAVDKKEGIIQKLFGLASLSIDSGSTTNEGVAEVIIHESSSVIDELSKEIDSKRFNTNASSEENVTTVVEQIESYTYSVKSKAIYSFINSFVLVLLCVLYTIIASIYLAFMKEKLIAVYYISLMLLGVAVITWICSFLSSLFMYYNFKVFKGAEELQIEHGLFVKINNKIAYNRIHGVVVTQSILQRIFGFASIGISVVGYGMTSCESNQGTFVSYLIPFCQKKDVAKYIDDILPEYNYKEKEIASAGFKFHFLATFIITTLIYIACITLPLGILLFSVKAYLSILVATSSLYAFLLLVFLLMCILQYKNAGLTIEEDKLTIYTGSFNYKAYTIKKEHVTSVEKIDTYLRKKNNVATYAIHYFTNAMSNVAYVHILDNKYFTELENFINK